MGDVRMSKEELQDLLSQATKAGAEAAIAAIAAQHDANEQRKAPTDDDVLDQVRRAEKEATEKAWPQESVACKDPDTESTFNAIVVKSRRFPAGLVIRLDEYQHSPKTMLHQNEGGFVAPGMDIKTDKGELTVQFKQWRWENYYQADLRKYVGKSAARLPKVEKSAEQAA